MRSDFKLTKLLSIGARQDGCVSSELQSWWCSFTARFHYEVWLKETRYCPHIFLSWALDKKMLFPRESLQAALCFVRFTLMTDWHSSRLKGVIVQNSSSFNCRGFKNYSCSSTITISWAQLYLLWVHRCQVVRLLVLVDQDWRSGYREHGPELRKQNGWLALSCSTARLKSAKISFSDSLCCDPPAGGWGAITRGYM